MSQRTTSGLETARPCANPSSPLPAISRPHVPRARAGPAACPARPRCLRSRERRQAATACPEESPPGAERDTGFSSGSATIIAVPWSMPPLSTRIVPPWSSTNPFATASPRPSPPLWRSRGMSACVEGLEQALQHRGFDAATQCPLLGRGPGYLRPRRQSRCLHVSLGPREG